MLRISETSAGGPGTILRLDGRLVGPWVTELEHACERTLARGALTELDLGGVEYLDRRGVSLLVELRSRGVALVAIPPFVQEQMKAATAG